MSQPVRRPVFTLLCAALAGCAASPPDAGRSAVPWAFAVSGDSRNCGNLVMPAIADAVRAGGERFYWHLGDLRRIKGIDEDYMRERRFAAAPPSMDDYLKDAWQDFSEHQVRPFGTTPFFLGIGNHETIAPKDVEQFRAEFATLLDRPELHAQRLRDVGRIPAPVGNGAPSYYHWITDGVDFVNLDNATGDRFDADQLRWFDAVVDADLHDAAVRTLVVGMHEALPHSLADNHSMCASTEGIRGGERVYAKLVDAQKRGRHVYVLASHSHFYLEDIYTTAYRRDPKHGGIALAGWIVGTAGAVRYSLPADVKRGPGAREHVYGYLSGRVEPGGTIAFTFHELAAADLERARSADYLPEAVNFCFAGNPTDMPPPPPAPACLAEEP